MARAGVPDAPTATVPDVIPEIPVQNSPMIDHSNPFPDADAARHAIWEMLVRRDIDAFLATDWSMVENDFARDRFFGMHGRFLANPDSWQLRFPDLDSYRDEWLRQARETAASVYAEPLRDALFGLTNLRDIELQGDRAVARKKFDGTIDRGADGVDRLNWQTLYFCARIDGSWKITGFVGYLPHPLHGG